MAQGRALNFSVCVIAPDYNGDLFFLEPVWKKVGLALDYEIRCDIMPYARQAEPPA
jgi:hypothetical protein